MAADEKGNGHGGEEEEQVSINVKGVPVYPKHLPSNSNKHIAQSDDTRRYAVYNMGPGIMSVVVGEEGVPDQECEIGGPYPFETKHMDFKTAAGVEAYVFWWREDG